MVVNQLNK